MLSSIQDAWPSTLIGMMLLPYVNESRRYCTNHFIKSVLVGERRGIVAGKKYLDVRWPLPSGNRNSRVRAGV